MATWIDEDLRCVQLAHTLWRAFGSGVPTDIVRIADELGLRAYLKRLPKSLRGTLHSSRASASHALGTIMINDALDEPQIRYTLAHEVMHAACRHGLLTVRHARVERVCQLGAANLLLPAHLLLTDSALLYGRHDLVDCLARRYVVSREAMVIQLQRLGVLASPPSADDTWPTAERLLLENLGLLPGDASRPAEPLGMDKGWADGLLAHDLDDGSAAPPTARQKMVQTWR